MRAALLFLAPALLLPALAADPAPPAAHGLAFKRGLVCEQNITMDFRNTSCADPIGGVEVVVKDSLGNVFRASTDVRGEFVFPQAFPMDGRSYQLTVAAMGYYGAFSLAQAENTLPARDASQIQVIFGFRREAPDPLDSRPILFCDHGVRYLLHSGEPDNLCWQRGPERHCTSARNPQAYAEATCEGCTATGGPGSCCRMGTADCDLRTVLDRASARK